MFLYFLIARQTIGVALFAEFRSEFVEFLLVVLLLLVEIVLPTSTLLILFAFAFVVVLKNVHLQREVKLLF